LKHLKFTWSRSFWGENPLHMHWLSLRQT
jgi:hypothetical protein